jgi:hypothetical protein
LCDIITQKKTQLPATRKEIAKLREEKIARQRVLKCLRRFHWSSCSKGRIPDTMKQPYWRIPEIFREHREHFKKKEQELTEIILQETAQRDEKVNSGYVKILEREIEIRRDMIKTLKDCFHYILW